MSSPSKNKGSGFEREIAKFLSGLYSASFVRAPGSGAYTGGTNSHRKQTLHESQVRSFKGDIMPPDGFERFNAEAKFYADFAFHLLFTESSTIENWIDQLMAAADAGDLNILFMKFNRKGRYVAVQANIPWTQTCNNMRYTSKKYGDWIIFNLESFFNLNSEFVKTLSKK